MAASILAVDDSASMRQMVSFTLKGAGFDVVEAADGVQALNIARTRPVNLVITDVNMPNMDGISLIRELRALSGGQQRRVHLAHVLASEADLLLLDEPTAGLDAGANERYAQLIREELDRGASVAVATHDVRDAARADCVVLLAGRVIAAGAPRDVLTQEQLAHAFGIALLAIPHGDHTDLIVPEDAHAHDEHGMHDRHGHA